MAYMERKTNLSVNLNTTVDLKTNETQGEPSSNSEDPSSKILSETKEPSINTENLPAYPSIETLAKNVTVETTNKKEEYLHCESVFLNHLVEFTNDRNYILKLNSLFIEDNTGFSYWVSIRFKCLTECLLTFSEMKTIELDDLKEICNAFTTIIGSKYFQNLPQGFPYSNDILELKQSLKTICENSNEDQPLKFRLQAQNKNKLIAIRWELSHFVLKKTFSELNFKD